MTEITNFAQARRVLMSYVPPGTMRGNYTLERVSKLMNKLGSPQDHLKVVHVAGTSGKTSTCYYISALLQAAGQRVGLTVSPHIDEVNERVQINLKPLAETTFCQELTEFIEIVAKTGIKPTYFELLVAFAYWEFAKQGVDYAVVEVGLGGLLDGTNVISREDKICVITDIGLDHTDVLGNTLGAIAAQKAGIIQHRNHAIMYKQSDEVMGQINKRCAQMHASLFTMTMPATKDLPPDLPPFQQRNWHLARTAVDYIYNRDNLALPSEGQISKAAHTRVPARMEVVKYQGQLLIIDGSHNGQKMTALVDGIRKLYAQQPVAALVSFVQSERERANGALEQLHKLTSTLIVTSFSGQQDMPKHSVDPKITATAAHKIGFKNVIIVNDPEKAFYRLMRCPEPVKLVTGSFYLLNHIRPMIFLTLEPDKIPPSS